MKKSLLLATLLAAALVACGKKKKLRLLPLHLHPPLHPHPLLTLLLRPPHLLLLPLTRPPQRPRPLPLATRSNSRFDLPKATFGWLFSCGMPV